MHPAREASADQRHKTCSDTGATGDVCANTGARDQTCADDNARYPIGACGCRREAYLYDKPGLDHHVFGNGADWNAVRRLYPV